MVNLDLQNKHGLENLKSLQGHQIAHCLAVYFEGFS